MSISMHVVGFRPPDEKFNKMKAIWDACKSANVEVPKEVGEFFNWENENVDANGVRVDLDPPKKY
jgi:hypothetical protein